MSHHHHEINVELGGSKKTLSGYVIGFILCIILTVMSFGVVENRFFSTEGTYIALSTLAIIQLFVQSLFFLRLNASQDGRWNLMPFLFAIVIIAILVSGSLWIMYSLNYNMSH